MTIATIESILCLLALIAVERHVRNYKTKLNQHRQQELQNAFQKGLEQGRKDKP